MLVAATLQAQTRYYIGIDLGSSGTKAMLYSFTDGAPKPVLDRTIDTKLVSSMNGGRYTPAGIQDAAGAAKQLIADLKAAAAEKRLGTVDSVYILGSSGVARGENKDELATAVKTATGVEMQFVDAKQEAYYGLITAVPRKNRGSAILVDIGSGNTKLGCLVGEQELRNLKSAEISIGSKSGRNAALKKNPDDVQSGIQQVIKEDVRPAFKKESMDAPCLRNRRLIYWSGGAAWATATFMHPEAAQRAYVKVTKADLDRFVKSLSDGSWIQKEPVYHFSDKVPAKTRKAIQEDAQKHRQNVMNIFVGEDLISGVSIMRTVLAESNPAAEIYFVRNGGYIYGYAKEKFQADDE
jgi:exopolyphosphatase/pppGpp-phosphohydrolase